MLVKGLDVFWNPELFLKLGHLLSGPMHQDPQQDHREEENDQEHGHNTHLQDETSVMKSMPGSGMMKSIPGNVNKEDRVEVR